MNLDRPINLTCLVYWADKVYHIDRAWNDFQSLIFYIGQFTIGESFVIFSKENIESLGFNLGLNITTTYNVNVSPYKKTMNVTKENVEKFKTIKYYNSNEFFQITIAHE